MVVVPDSHSGEVNASNFKSHAGLIAGVTIGVVAVVTALALLAYKLLVKRNGSQNSSQSLSVAIKKSLLNKTNGRFNTVSCKGQKVTKSWSGSGESGEVSPILQSRENSPDSETREHFDGDATSGMEAAGRKISGGKSSKKVARSSSDEENTNLGEVHFQVTYDAGKQLLMVTINKCTNLPVKDLQIGSSDPYVKLQLLPEKRHRTKTRVLRKTTNPVYDETFTFFGLTPAQLKGISMHFVVLSFDRFSRDDIIGEVLFPLKHVEFKDVTELSFVKEIVPRQFKIISQSRGELLISLCHQPASNRLTVVILKARNLPKIDATGVAGDPYVKIYLLYNGQKIAKKKTHVKKRTFNPVFNESFVFEVPCAPLNENLLENMSVEFMVLDWDRVIKNETIGRLELGYSALKRPDEEDCLGHKHWEDVIQNPRKQIAMWHKLEPVE